MDAPDLFKVRDSLIEVAYKAGEMIVSANPSSGDTGSKKNSIDLVTDTDKEVETFIFSTLREKYPDYEHMGEETEAAAYLTDKPTFIVDPIDGTTNFVHGYPYVSIALGFAVNKTPHVGVVYNPYTQTLYQGVKGHGSFRNDVPLPLRSEGELITLNSAQVAVEWGSDRGTADFEVKAKTFARLARAKEVGGAMVHSLRSLGSAALNLCAVAEGSIDVYWEGGCYAWDVCAGWVVLVEAGGQIVDGNPGNWEPKLDGMKYLAVRKGATKGLIEEFWDCIEGRLSYTPHATPKGESA